MKIKSAFSRFVVGCAILALGISTQWSVADEKTTAEKPEVVALTFYAEWCASCKVLDPRVDQVRQELGAKPIYFTRFDLTDEATQHQSHLFANWVGLGGIYQEHAPKTGFMLLIDPRDNKVLNRLTRQHSEQEIRQAIDEALAAVAASSAQREPGS